MNIQIRSLQELSDLQWQRYFELHQYLQKQLNTPFPHPDNFEAFSKMKHYFMQQEDLKEHVLFEEGKVIAWLQYKVYGKGQENAYSEIYFDTLYEQIPNDLLDELKQLILQCQTLFQQDKTYAFEAHNPRFEQLIRFCGAKVIGTNVYFELEKKRLNTPLIEMLLDSTILEENELQFAFYDSLPEHLHADYTRLFNEGFSSIQRSNPIPIQLMTLEETAKMVANFTQSGSQIFTAWLINSKNQAIAYTLIYLENREIPEIGTQWLTVVTKAYQGKKLAQYLKGAMLKAIFAAIPQLELIRTNCTSVNYPMIAINKKNGFQQVEEKHEYVLAIC